MALPSRTNAGSDISHLWSQHVDFLNGLPKYPEANVYQRFYKQRMMRNLYLEYKVRKRTDAVEMLERPRSGMPNYELASLEYEQKFEKAMNELINSVNAHSLAYEQDRKMAAATAVEPYFMNYFREQLQGQGEQRAPNGESVSIYGMVGDEVSDDFTSMRDVHLELFSRFIVHRCMNPINNHLIQPCRSFWYRIFYGGRSTPRREILDQQIVQHFAKILEVMLATLSLAAAIVTLYSINTMKYRLVGMTLFGLLFSLEVVFLGQGSIGIFALNAGYFAAMVVFVGTTSSVSTPP
jgi:hypothetical protein